jgi:hypothetical protein
MSNIYHSYMQSVNDSRVKLAYLKKSKEDEELDNKYNGIIGSGVLSGGMGLMNNITANALKKAYMDNKEEINKTGILLGDRIYTADQFKKLGKGAKRNGILLGGLGLGHIATGIEQKRRLARGYDDTK